VASTVVFVHDSAIFSQAKANVNRGMRHSDLAGFPSPNPSPQRCRFEFVCHGKFFRGNVAGRGARADRPMDNVARTYDNDRHGR
jgi:hypothetical protein